MDLHVRKERDGTLNLQHLAPGAGDPEKRDATSRKSAEDQAEAKAKAEEKAEKIANKAKQAEASEIRRSEDH